MSNDRHKSPSSEHPDAPMLRKVAAEIEQAFPLVARHTELVLFDVDSYHLQAQWQVEPGHLEQIRRAFPAGTSVVRPQLRLLRLDAPGDRRIAAVLSPMIEPGEIDGSARFNVSDYGSTYQAELGLANEEGGWLLLARSNQVQLPKPVAFPKPSRRNAEPPETIGTGPSIAGESIALEEGSVQKVGEIQEPETETAERPTGNRRASFFDPTLADSGVRLAPVFPHPHPRSAWSPSAVFLKVIGVLDTVDPEIEAVPLPVSSQPASGPMTDAVSTSRESTSHLPADSPPPRLSSSSHSESGSASGELPLFPTFDPYGTFSSSHLPPDTSSRPDFEIHAELLVYGRATPGSFVRVLGQNLAVGANGRFFVRRALEETQLAGEVFFSSPSGKNDEPETE